LPPVADRSRFVKQGGEITSGVHYIASPGHSPIPSGRRSLTTTPRRRSNRVRPSWTGSPPIRSW
jgi:hypothetical protein